MLSKLRHATRGNAKADNPSVSRAEIDDFAKLLGGSILHPLRAGTLNASFIFDADENRRFAKTNATPQGAASIVREARVLQNLYGARLDVVLHSVGPRNWLVMNALDVPAQRLGAVEVQQLLADIRPALSSSAIRQIVPVEDDFALLLAQSGLALDQLHTGGHIRLGTQRWVAKCIALLRDQCYRFDPIVCHGDLGGANVLVDNAGPVAIDWEDIFWGIEGYDYLYWLTFTAQRHMYSPAIFGHTGWDKDVEIAILIMIIVLKSWLSVLSGSNAGNALSFDNRIMEIANFA